ncbi:FMN-binding negative transcriptional regulator [Phytoactinopolyspora halotolerans]|uniref:FMN-binding negative transcriptional regulator n=1 Tax=Phytoactinopolyspora halotolerans TaxID=1981512 RepID=A0A6L9SCJ8_9ACTN|nr:FMN-binding negative transcriptional regulator [Phytoactinopolyspora halotolerans]NEE01730.1 FMN-binding negative transcriptional regulator [Phytoactinopolyspora halotolerans]
MHTPRHYQAGAPSRISRLIRENPFGLIVSANGDGVPLATHVPMLRSPTPAGPPSDDVPLEGSRIIGHMARVNPQWKSFTDGGQVLAVFSGPDGYVSPTVYQVTPAAPTWNYAAVHITGPVRLIEDADDALRTIMATIDVTEAHTPTAWDPSGSMDYIERILPGIAAFEITAERVDSQFKLSQEKPAEIQHRVHDSFAASPHGRDRELAALMSDVLGLGSVAEN